MALPTSRTLLGQLCSASRGDGINPPSDAERQEAWRQLERLYRPLVFGFLMGRCGLQSVEAQDIFQDVLRTLVESLPQFKHNGRPGAFRAWLRKITSRCAKQYCKKRARAGTSLAEDAFAQLADPRSGTSHAFHEDHDQHCLRYLIRTVEVDFEAKTMKAFQRVELDGMEIEVAATELGMTVQAVYQAKSRVLRRLRQAGAELREILGFE